MSLRRIDFHCKACCPYPEGPHPLWNECPATFEELIGYDAATETHEKVICSNCGGDVVSVWASAPGVAGDENLTALEKAAVATFFAQRGFDPDKGIPVPQTREDMKKFRRTFGDIPVTQQEILTPPPRKKYEPEMTKAERIAQVAKIRAMRRSGDLPRRAVDAETAAAVKKEAKEISKCQ